MEKLTKSLEKYLSIIYSLSKENKKLFPKDLVSDFASLGVFSLAKIADFLTAFIILPPIIKPLTKDNIVSTD